MSNEKPLPYTQEQIAGLFKVLPQQAARQVVFAACSMNAEQVYRTMENVTLVHSCVRLQTMRKELGVPDPIIETYESFTKALFALAKIDQQKEEMQLSQEKKLLTELPTEDKK